MKYLIIISLLIFPMLGISQAPQRINFQSVLRNTNGEVVSKRTVSLRISILSDSITGTAVYVETHARTTDAGGLMSLQIGSGTLPNRDFAAINWGNSVHFIKLEADFSGGNNYVLLGTQELMSVPYALYASKTDTSVLNLSTRLATKLNITDTSLLNLTSRFSTKLNISDFPAGSDTGNIMYFNGASWINLAPGAEGYFLKMSSGIPEWGTVPTNTVGGATSAPTLMVNTGLTPITHSTTNATGIGTATGLPTGVTASWSANRITISGTPSSSGTFSYNIPLSGGCGCVNATGTITVTAPCATGAASTTPTLTLNKALTPITHTTTSATGIGSATGLPSGVSAAWVSNVIIIMGTPSASGNFNYTIPLTGTGCTSLNATGTITVVTACGSVSSVSDIDGNPYSTVSIGNQCWTKENLRVRRYNDNTEIKFDKSGGTAGNLSGQTWSGLTYGAHTLYEYDSTGGNSSILGAFGYLYNWYAAKGIATAGSTDYKNICPTGWHVPTDSAWTTLTTYLGGESVAGGKMKLSGTDIWTGTNTFATDESGFTALPGGYRNYDGRVNLIKFFGFFWSSTEDDSIDRAWLRRLDFSGGSVLRNYYFESVGASVRCLRD